MTKQYAKLRELCEVISGSTPKTNVPEYWNGTLKWITPAEIGKECYVFDSERHISEEGAKSANLRPLPPGTVILSSRAPIGKTAIAGCELYCNQGFKNLICSSALVPEYLYYFLSYNTRRLNLLGRGATFKELSKSIVENIEIPLINLTQQKHIVHILQNIDRLIVKYSNAYSTLNKIVKSRFMEMFGDPISNSKNFEQKKLNQVTEKIGSGATPKGGESSYSSEGVSLIRSKNVHNGYFQYKDLAHISDSQAKQLDNVTVRLNDVLLNITGASVARCCVVPQNVLPARVNQHVSIIRCQQAQLDCQFLNAQLISKVFQEHLIKLGESGGATRQAITKQQLEQLKIIVPPLPLQQQFADFVEKVDKSKLAVKQSLEKLETLKKSLMQQYFG